MKLMGKAAVATYAVALHAALAVVLVNSDFTERVGRKFGKPNEQQAKILARQDAWAQLAPAGATVFLGDSLTEGLPASAVAPVAVNFGIGGIQAADLQRDLPHYSAALQRADRVFLLIGTNDVLRGQFSGLDGRIAAIVGAIPAGKPLVLASVPPSLRQVDAVQLRALNEGIRATCARRSGCSFVDSAAVFAPAGQPLAELFVADGLHFSVEGYRRWVRRLKIEGMIDGTPTRNDLSQAGQ